jgi:hypothetical protein
MTLVVVKKDDNLTEEIVDMQHSTISKHFQDDMHISYYYEHGQDVTYSGMKSTTRPLYIFVKLINGEPVDLHVEEFLEQWKRFPECIPDDI